MKEHDIVTGTNVAGEGGGVVRVFDANKKTGAIDKHRGQEDEKITADFLNPGKFTANLWHQFTITLHSKHRTTRQTLFAPFDLRPESLTRKLTAKLSKSARNAQLPSPDFTPKPDL